MTKSGLRFLEDRTLDLRFVIERMMLLDNNLLCGMSRKKQTANKQGG